MAQENHTAHAGDCPAIPILLPEGFDAKDHLPPWLDRFADKASILVHRIRTGSIRDGNRRCLSLPREDMEKHFGHHRNWMEVRSSFEAGGIWSNDHIAIKGEKAYWYYLLAPWKDRKLVRHSIVDGRVVREITDEERQRRGREGWLPVHHHLERILQGVRIDADAAEEWLAEQDADRQLEAHDLIALFSLGRPRCSRDPFGRFHTPVTRLPRGLRPFLRFRGIPFASLDVSACQPFLLGLSCLPWFRLPAVAPTKGTERGDGNDPLLPSVSVHTPGRQLSEVDAGLGDYLAACSENRYYAEFAGMRGMPYETREEKQAVKDANCIMLYGRRNPGREFTRRWRVVAEKIRSLKERDYHDAAATLQRLESALMIEGVCADLMRDHPEMPILTIHDGIMFPPEGESVVREAIDRHVGCFGFPVHLK